MPQPRSFENDEKKRELKSLLTQDPSLRETMMMQKLIELELARVDPQYWENYQRQKDAAGTDIGSLMRIDFSLAQHVDYLMRNGQISSRSYLQRYSQRLMRLKTVKQLERALASYQSERQKTR